MFSFFISLLFPAHFVIISLSVKKGGIIMTFQQLQYLLEVSRSGSVTKAAKKLFVSYSSVSISISNLEKELGYSLFTRTQNGLIPTVRGEKVLEYANLICQAFDQINAVKQETKRTIRISCGDNPIFARAYARLIEENINNTDVNFILTAASDNVKKLILNDVHLCLRMQLDFSMGYWDRQLKANQLHREILRIIPAAIQVGQSHRLYNAEKILPHELGNDPFLDDPVNPVTKSSLFNGAIYVDPSKVLYARGINTRNELVARGLAYALCSMPPKNPQKKSPFRYIPLEGVNYHLLAITNPSQPIQPEISRFLTLLREELDNAYSQ